MKRFLTVIVCALLSACGDDEGFTNSPIPAGALTVVNTIPTSPPLNVVTNNIGTGTISFGESTPTASVLPQIPLDFSISFINDGVQQTVFSDNFTIDVDFSQTLFLTGTIANPVVTTIVEPPFVYADGTTDTRIRFMNATSSIASATVTLTNPNGAGATVAMTNGQPTGFVTTTEGQGLQMEIRDTSSNALLWQSGDFSVAAGADRLYVLSDYFGPGDETVRMFSVNDPSGIAPFSNEVLDSALRFSNQTADRGTLDFYVEGNLEATLAFGEESDFITVAAGTNNVVVTPTGDAATELNNADRTVFRGLFYTLSAAANESNESGLGTAFFAEDRRGVDGRAIVTVTKLAPAVPQVDLYFQDVGEALGGLPDVAAITDFASGPLSSIAGDYDFYVTETGNTNILLGPERLSLDALGFYTIQITDSAGGGTPLRLDLIDDFQN